MTDHTTTQYDQARAKAEGRFVTAGNNPRTPEPADHAAVEEFTEAAIQLGTAIEAALDDSRYKSLALTALEEALTWANKGAYADGARELT